MIKPEIGDTIVMHHHHTGRLLNTPLHLELIAIYDTHYNTNPCWAPSKSTQGKAWDVLEDYVRKQRISWDILTTQEEATQ